MHQFDPLENVDYLQKAASTLINQYSHPWLRLLIAKVFRLAHSNWLEFDLGFHLLIASDSNKHTDFSKEPPFTVAKKCTERSIRGRRGINRE
jgi:hypothetical protein